MSEIDFWIFFSSLLPFAMVNFTLNVICLCVIGKRNIYHLATSCLIPPLKWTVLSQFRLYLYALLWNKLPYDQIEELNKENNTSLWEVRKTILTGRLVRWPTWQHKRRKTKHAFVSLKLTFSYSALWKSMPKCLKGGLVEKWGGWRGSWVKVINDVSKFPLMCQKGTPKEFLKQVEYHYEENYFLKSIHGEKGIYRFWLLNYMQNIDLVFFLNCPS